MITGITWKLNILNPRNSWRVLFDLNILLDVLMSRKPHYENAARLWALVETGQIQGFVAAYSFTTLYYLYKKQQRRERAYQTIRKILRVFDVAMVDRTVIEMASDLTWGGFEDGVQAAAASKAGCQYLITRDLKDYQTQPISPILPADFLAIWASQ